MDLQYIASTVYGLPMLLRLQHSIVLFCLRRMRGWMCCCHSFSFCLCFKCCPVCLPFNCPLGINKVILDLDLEVLLLVQNNPLKPVHVCYCRNKEADSLLEEFGTTLNNGEGFIDRPLYSVDLKNNKI